MSLASHKINPSRLAQMIVGYHHFLGWASKYGKQLVALRHGHRQFPQLGNACMVELSYSMSASFNFGYDTKENVPYLVIDSEEFDWLKLMPVIEVIAGDGYLAVVIEEVMYEDVRFDPLIIKIINANNAVWLKVSDAKSVGFACLHHSDGGFEVSEISSDVYPLRCLN